MTKACEDALKQIEEKDYEASLRDEQYENIAKLWNLFLPETVQGEIRRCEDHFEY